MSKAMSLKAKIRNIAKEKNIPAQVILQNYMFERHCILQSNKGQKDSFFVIYGRTERIPSIG